MNRVIPPAVVVIGILACVCPLGAADGPLEKPKVWAIAIGIDRYEDTLIPPCKGAVRDSRAVADWFARQAGWGEKNVLRMDNNGRKTHDAPSAEIRDLLPTRANLDWAVVEWLGHRVRPNDVVVIYFAGQAASKAPRPGTSAGRAYLLPVDARGGDVSSTGWSLDDALDRAKTLAEKKARVVIWLDTSTSGRGEAGLPRETGAPSGQDWLRALTRWPGVTAWLAADGRLAAEAGSPGPFVAALLKSLGTIERAHNLLGTLQALRGETRATEQGFRAMGGIAPGVSLWAGGALVVEEAVPELIVQSGHGDRVTSVLVMADSARMITAGHDSTVRAWNLADRSLVRVLADPFVGVEALATDRDGSVLIAGDGMGRLTGWNMALDRPKPYYGPTDHAEGIVDLAFLPDASSFVSRDRAGKSFLWDAGQGAIKKVGVLSGEPLGHIAASTRPVPGALALVAAVEPVPGGRGRLLGFDGSGKPVSRYDGPGGRITSLDLADDGSRLVMGDDRGRVRVLGLPAGTVVHDQAFDGPISLARLSKSGLLLISDARSLRLVEPRSGGVSVVLADSTGTPVSGEVERSAFSSDGRWLAACGVSEGRTFAWRLTDPGRPVPVALPGDEAPAIVPAFSPDGRTLVVGDALGGIRAWDLEAVGAGPKATPRPPILPSRGKVAGLAASPSGRYLMEITKDDLALVWDLEEGRGCKPLPGSWAAGAFLPDDSKVVMVRKADEGGELVLLDRVAGTALPTTFERPAGPDGRPSNAGFGAVVVSKSGRWVAAASLGSQRPLACVWRVADGKLAHVARDHNGGLTGVDLSGDEAYLLTASEDGSAKLWPLEDPKTELHQDAITLFNPAAKSPAITAAKVSPVNPRRVVTGTRGGYVFLWDWARGKGKQTLVELGQLDGEVASTVFSSDGRWVAASGVREKSIRFWSIPEVGPHRAVTFRPLPHHGEQVGSLVAWPNGATIVSGGDDAAVRFWDLKGHSLVGTLVAQGRADRSVDWLAYTPEGLFDGSRPGESIVKWRVGEKIVTLEQSEDTHHVFQLAGAFGKGEKPKGPELKDEAPRLKIDTPPDDRTVEGRDVELTIWTGDPDPAALRLYQNGVPVRGETDFRPGAGPNFLTTRVSLRRGENRFYAMASKPGTIDGRSDELTLRYEGPEAPGRVHTLAIGISDYRNRPLKYAHLDARTIADILHSRGVAGLDRPGEQIVLTDEDVTPDRVDDAFRRLRDAVKGKPEDTVVLFLAGHTDTDAQSEQFCLLLPDFPFEGAPPPALDVAIRGNPGLVQRGNAGENAGSFRTKVGGQGVFPYVLLYNRLARLEALQRLVIVDACQAGAILEDPAVRNIRRLVDRGSRKARNTYLLAARRGEPANEADALEHGLLTYTLLQGMGATGLRRIPDDLGGFPGRANADRDGDGLVSSEELVAYTDETLPRLARLFPQLVMRAGNAPPVPAPGPDPAGSPELEQKLKLSASESSFPLIALPK